MIQPIWYTNYMNRYSTIESTKSLLLVQQQVEWVLWPHAEDNTGIKSLLNGAVWLLCVCTYGMSTLHKPR